MCVRNQLPTIHSMSRFKNLKSQHCLVGEEIIDEAGINTF